MIKIIYDLYEEALDMAKKVTKKKPLFGNLRSHALNITKTRQKPNLQKKTINGEKVIISAREAKKLNKKEK
jgi:ribosomal protein L28